LAPSANPARPASTPPSWASSAAYTDLIHKLGGKAMDGLYATMTVQNPYLDESLATDPLLGQQVQDQVQRRPHRVLGLWLRPDRRLPSGARKAGPNLSTDSFIKAMDTMKIPPDIFGSAELTFSPTKRLGSNATRLSQLQDARWKVVSEYMSIK
jgi:branched-chain amino acid transport system substrate-binding protein